MRKTVLLWPLLLVLLIPGCVRSGTRTTVVTNMKGDARRTEILDLDLASGDSLVLVADSDEIEARKASGSPKAIVDLVVVAYTQEEAETALRAFRVETTRTPRGLEVRVVGDAGTYEIEGGARVPYRAFASFLVTVPEDVKVMAASE